VTIAVGVNLSPVPPNDLPEAAVLAEQLGFESGWIGEHVIIPWNASVASPYVGHPQMRPDLRFYEPFVALAHVAARTSTLRLGTGIVILPLRDPFLTARAIATADQLSGGRLLVGIGSGWLRDEFEILGIPFESRGRRLDEQLAVLDTLFADDRPEHHGRIWDFPASGFVPKPAQRPRPPILLGGISAPALRRCASVADGWFGSRHTPEEVAKVAASLSELRGSPMPLSVGAVGGASPAEYADAGAQRLVVTPWRTASQWRKGMEDAAGALGLWPSLSPPAASGGSAS
jgi:probable F420-dependent oxidoreductase